MGEGAQATLAAILDFAQTAQKRARGHRWVKTNAPAHVPWSVHPLPLPGKNALYIL
jgi:hypothetical protein